MSNLIGVYWSVMHRRQEDYAYFMRLQPSVFKIMDGGPPDYEWAKNHLKETTVIARDWALSEQHGDMLRSPAATGKRHAREWSEHQQRLGFDKARTLILGINEPKVWDAGVPEALRIYTINLCREAQLLGLRVGAMQFSVGWPANQGEGQAPDWSPFHGVEAAIKAGNHVLIVHEYWADQGPNENWGWWGGRVLKCPWQVPIMVGETGIDIYVKDTSGPHNARGWQGRVSPARYARELAEYASKMSADPRFKGSAVFATDFANREWYSFDTLDAHEAILATHIPEAPPVQPPITPPITPPGSTALVHPLPGSTITQHWGENGEEYERFGHWGHNGTDMGGRPIGTVVRCLAVGVVAHSSFDPSYGHYVRVDHGALGCYSFYAHLNAPGAAAGTRLDAGGTVGLLGTSGNSTGPHLHLEIRLHDASGAYTVGTPMVRGRVDPESFLIQRGLKL